MDPGLRWDDSLDFLHQRPSSARAGCADQGGAAGRIVVAPTTKIVTVTVFGRKLRALGLGTAAPPPSDDRK
jgi:hypothetical protein